MTETTKGAVAARRLVVSLAGILLALSVQASANAAEVLGKVMDFAGKPVAGATVWRAHDGQATKRTTDANGAFRFAETELEPCILVARKPGLSLGGLFLPAPGPTPVAITLYEAASLTLGVKGPSGEPLVGVAVRSMRLNDLVDVPVEDLEAEGFPVWRSDAKGMLSFEDLPKNGFLRFVAAHRDYADTGVAYLPVTDKPQSIVMMGGVRLRGRVSDDAGKPVGGACVTVLRRGAGPRRTAGCSTTDPEGYYRVILKPSDYTVCVRHAAYASPKPQEVNVKDPVDDTDTTTNVVNLTLHKARKIEGSVALENGTPCRAASISYWIDGTLYAETFTQVNGTYRFVAPADAGEIRLCPPDGYMLAEGTNTAVPAGDQSPYSVPSFRLAKLPSVEGTVTNESGAPEADVLVCSLNISPPMLTITDAEGKFRFILARAPETDTVARFRAEHAQRFLRADFEASLHSPAPVKAVLKEFEPDLSERKVGPNDNDLTGLVGKPAPALTCDAWFNSDAVTMESLRGKVVVLTFWSSFDSTGPGRDRIEELRALYDLLKGVPDVVLLAVHDSTDAAVLVEKAVKDYKLLFPVAHDTDPFVTSDRYKAVSIPQTVLIDKKGVVRYFQVDGRLLELIKSLRREG